MSSLPIDSPDHQVGVVNAGALLAVVPIGTTTINITVPANAATLLIIGLTTSGGKPASVTGMTSGYKYGGLIASGIATSANGITYVWAVSSSIDPVVTLTFTSATTEVFYVATEISAEMLTVLALSQISSNNGESVGGTGIIAMGVSVPSVARPLKCDQSGNLIIAGARTPVGPTTIAVASTAILGAPSAGEFWYIYGCDITGTTAASVVTLYNGVIPFATISVPTSGVNGVQLDRYPCANAITATSTVAGCNVMIRALLGV